METASALSTERRPDGQLKRRTHRRIDELGHLADNGRHGREDHKSRATAALREIARCLLRIDVLTYIVLDDAEYSDASQIIGSHGPSEFEGAIKAPLKQLEDLIKSDKREYEEQLRHHLGQVSDDDIFESVCSALPVPYYEQLLFMAVILSREQKSWLGDVKNQLSGLNLENKQEYLQTQYTGISRARRRLQNIISEAQYLRDYIGIVAGERLLDEETLTIMETKVKALQRYFPEACVELGRPAENLIDLQNARWWNLQDRQGDHFQSSSRASKSAVQAYNDTRSTTATLLFLVPIICLLSGIPAALAWSHAPSKAGTVDDADFFSLIATSALQILSTVTLIWPTVFNSGLARLSWVWTWVLAISSVCCTGVAIPLYLFVPTSWSSLVSFGSCVAQALVTLQLVHGISSPTKLDRQRHGSDDS